MKFRSSFFARISIGAGLASSNQSGSVRRAFRSSLHSHGTPPTTPFDSAVSGSSSDEPVQREFENKWSLTIEVNPREPYAGISHILNTWALLDRVPNLNESSTCADPSRSHSPISMSDQPAVVVPFRRFEEQRLRFKPSYSVFPSDTGLNTPNALVSNCCLK